MSDEIECRRVSIATRLVTPLPAKKSSTVEPGKDSERTIRPISSFGFWVGWPTRSFELPLRRGIFQTLVGLMPLSRFSALSRLSRLDLERMRIERLPHGVEVEIVFWRPGKPGDLLMPVGEEALRTHAVRVIPDDEIGEQHLAVRPHPAHQAAQVAAAGFALILQTAEQHEIARRRQHALDFAEPFP